jgi:CheY-like chemotaxis protein
LALCGQVPLFPDNSTAPGALPRIARKIRTADVRALGAFRKGLRMSDVRPEHHAGGGRRGTILLVEDDAAVRDFAAMLLADAGHKVIKVPNGDIALILLREGAPADVLFTDVVMFGELDGFAMAEEAKRLRPELRILYATAFPGFARVTNPEKLHGPLLMKPYRPARLLEEIERLLSA